MNKIKMNKINKIAFTTLISLAVPALAFAQHPAVNGLNLCAIINGIENALWIIFGAIAVISFVIAGILFLVSGGDPEKVGTARRAFLWGVAGIVVGIIAYSIIAIVATGIGVGVSTGC